MVNDEKFYKCQDLDSNLLFSLYLNVYIFSKEYKNKFMENFTNQQYEKIRRKIESFRNIDISILFFFILSHYWNFTSCSQTVVYLTSAISCCAF